MNVENPSTSPEAMKQILVNNHGAIFYEKRPLHIPTVAPERINQLFNPKYYDMAIQQINGLVGYLHKVPIGDKWGKDHDSRRKWRDQMEVQYPGVFKEVYDNGNQFRTNIMSGVGLNIAILVKCAEKAGNAQLVKQINPIIKEYTAKFAGKDPDTGKKIDEKYADLDDTKKLAYVHFFEDKIIEILGILAG